MVKETDADELEEEVQEYGPDDALFHAL